MEFQTMGEEEEATVEVHVRAVCPDVDGFHNSLPVPFGSSLECGAYPVDAMVVGLLNVKCNVVLSVLTQPDYQWPLGSPMYVLTPPGYSTEVSYTTPVCNALGSCSSSVASAPLLARPPMQDPL